MAQPIPALELLEPRLMLAAVSWDGGGDGASWTDRFNWSGDALPISTSDVTIDVVADPTITLSSGTYTIHSLSSSETLVFSGGTLTVSTGGSSNCSVTVSGGTLNLRGSWSQAGGLTVSSGTLELGGAFRC